jgi:hypothetical protein
MAHVWKESEKSLKYFKVYENNPFGFIHLFFSTLLMLGQYWVNSGKKEKGKHEDGEKWV